MMAQLDPTARDSLESLGLAAHAAAMHPSRARVADRAELDSSVLLQC